MYYLLHVRQCYFTLCVTVVLCGICCQYDVTLCVTVVLQLLMALHCVLSCVFFTAITLCVTVVLVAFAVNMILYTLCDCCV